MSENLTTKEIFKPVACTTPLNPCTFCGWPAELFSRSNADGTFSEKAVMCSNFGDDDPIGNACPLHLPPEDFYHATKREAVEYWNERTARGKERITAALTAEVAELRLSADANLYAAQQHMLRESVMASEVAELRRDAERYRFCAKHGFPRYHFARNPRHGFVDPSSTTDHYHPAYWAVGIETADGKTLEFGGATPTEAIDSARAALGEQP